MSICIREAASEGDYRAFGLMIRAYVEWCRVRYAHEPWLMEMAFGYQALDRELEMLNVAYGPPRGKTLLACDGEDVQGAVAYRDLGDGICEMKRLYVPEPFHGRGIGRRLGAALVTQAAVDGFTLMRLDTGKAFTEAISLYTTIGFKVCKPYIAYPDRLMPMMVFMERRLSAA